MKTPLRPRLSLLTLAVLLASAAQAQILPPGAGFDWERVGHVPINAKALAFDADGTLWASGADGMYRLDTTATGGYPGEWITLAQVPLDEQPADRILVLHPDTLVIVYGWVLRSTDGGRTFEFVLTDTGYDGLAEIPPEVPHAGRLLVGETTGIQHADGGLYSDDRGATWTPASAAPEWAEGADLAVLPAGSPWAGRVVAAGSGAMLSDDGGETYYASSLWRGGAVGQVLCVVERPGAPGSVRVLMEGFISGGGGRIWWSDDGGQTWTATVPPGLDPPRVILSLGGASTLMVGIKGTIQRSDDGGETWELVGRAPVRNGVGYFLNDAAVGPDGRLYVAVSRGGCCDFQWVYRTAEAVPVAAEPGAEPEPAGLRLEVSPNPARGAAEVAFTLARPSAVTVTVHDVLGREVAAPASGHYGAGRHALTVGSGLPAGSYVVRVTVADPARGAGEVVTAGRLTVVR